MKRFFFNVLSLGLIVGLVLTSCEDEFTEEQALEQQRQILEALNNADNANALAIAGLDAENAIALAELSTEQQMAFQMYQDSLERIGPVVNYSVSVIAAGTVNVNARTSGEAFAPGATVTVAQGGVSRTETAGDAGVATFSDLRVGQAIVTVSAPDHTTVTYVTNMGDPGDLRESNVETTIPLLPTTVAAGASEVSGTVFAQLDATTEDAEVVEGAIVRATLSIDDVMDDFGICLGCTGEGEIQKASYSDFTKIDTTDANGMYTLVIPNGLADEGEGLSATIEFLPYEGTQTFYAEQGDTIALVTKTVRFDPDEYGDGGDDIDTNLPGVWAEVSAPGGDAPSGFELGTATEPTFITSSDLIIASGGTDYKVGDIFAFATGVDGDSKASTDYAFIEVDDVDVNGRILDYNWYNNGALYIASPGVPMPATAAQITELNTDYLETWTEPAGNGATFELQFQVQYRLFVANGGSGYGFFPTVSVTAQDYEDIGGGGDALITVADFNINTTCCGDGAAALDGMNGQLLFNLASFQSGVIVADAGDGDTLEVIGPFAAAPTFDILPIEQRTATILPEDISVNSEGEITSISYDDGGSGYGSAPTITIKSATGMGSGATVIVTIFDGELDELIITNPGSGYMDEINFDNDDPENVFNDQDQEDSWRFQPGQSTTNYNFNYQFGEVIE